jgi:hypothetical protein
MDGCLSCLIPDQVADVGIGNCVCALQVFTACFARHRVRDLLQAVGSELAIPISLISITQIIQSLALLILPGQIEQVAVAITLIIGREVKLVAFDLPLFIEKLTKSQADGLPQKLAIHFCIIDSEVFILILKGKIRKVRLFPVYLASILFGSACFARMIKIEAIGILA